MSSPDENVEVVRAIHAAVNRGDLEAALSRVDPAFVLDYEASRGPGSGVHHGREVVKRLFLGLWDVWDDFQWRAKSMTPRGDDEVLVMNSAVVRGKGSGVDVEAHGVQLWKLCDGTPVRMTLYQELADVPEYAAKSRQPS